MSHNTKELDPHSVFNLDRACDHCHQRKIKCDKRRPQCYECLKKNIKCNYGLRLKRGPKQKKKKISIQIEPQLISTQKSNTIYDAMLFELEFNKKMVEIWRMLSTKDGSNLGIEKFVQIQPKFDPATEAFIGSPDAVNNLMDDFNVTFRQIFSFYNHAQSLDFATKIWQATIDVHLSTLLQIFNGFGTSLLIATLEYIMVFLTGLKLHRFHDIATHMAKIAYHILNLLIYSRADTDDALTPEQTLKLMSSLSLLGNYFKMCINPTALHANALLIHTLYTKHKHSPVFKELEARMCCRMILNGKEGETEHYSRRFNELSSELSPNLHYHFHYHSSFLALFNPTRDIREAETSIQKAKFYIKWHLEQVPPESRADMTSFYDARLDTIHAEIAMRMGDAALAYQMLGNLHSIFARVSPAFKRLISSQCEFIASYPGNAHVRDYLMLFTNPNAVMTMSKQIYNQFEPTARPILAHDSSEWTENDNDSNESSSPELDVDSPPQFDLNVSDEVLMTLELVDPFGFDTDYESFPN